MPLNTVPGNQVQGVNTQGVEVNKDHVTVNIEWVDPATNQYFDPTTSSVTATKDGSAFDLGNITILTNLSRADETVGVWVFEFLAKNTQTQPATPLAAGDYVFTFTGSDPAQAIPTVTHVLGFTAASIPIEQYFVGALRNKLGDQRTRRYLVDDNTRTRWTNGELYSCLDDTRLAIGQTPPNPQILTWEFCYAETHEQLLTGAFICCLAARGVFESFNKFNYNDELSLNIDRSPFLQNAISLKAQWILSITAWKRSWQFSATKPIGMASGRFPAYLSRTLSMIPHMQNVFYG